MSRTNPTRYLGIGFCGIGVVLGFGSPTVWARAETWESPDAREAVDAEPASTRAVRAEDAAALLLDGVSARGPRARAVVATVGGYDSAHTSALFQSRMEVRLIGALTLTGAFALASGVDQARIQPRVGLKLQLLSQPDEGVDLAVGGGYRRDRYLQDDGMLEAFVALGRRIGAVSLLANVLYGSDLEGDDRKGDLRLGAMRAFGSHKEWQVGLGFNGEIDLASFDPRRGSRGDARYEAFAGPVATYDMGAWALLLEGGPMLINANGLRAGLATLGGIATAF